MAAIALFDWTAGGHRPTYVRRFVEALRTSATIVLALPQLTLDEIGDLGVETTSLGEPRPEIHGRFGRRRRSILAEETERLRSVASHVDQTVHLYADHVLSQLARTAPLPGAISIVLYYPRGHYSVDYGTRLPLNDRAIALAKEWAIGRWRKRSDAHCVLTLDEGAARRWAKMRGAPAHWLPEPPVLAIPSEERQVERNGCILYGSLHPRKGIDLVAQAVTRERTPVRLVLAGAVVDGYGPDLELQVNAMRAAGVTVDFRPFRHSELEGLRALASARCALLPYPRHAGMSRVLLEACSVGTPVVADNFGLLGHLVREHRLGLAVDTADPLALRGAILSLTADDRSESYSEPLAEFAARFTPGRFRSALQSALGLQDPERAAQGSMA